VTVAGGVAKMTKLAQGMLDLHSKRGAVDLPGLAALATAAGGSVALAQRIAGANTAAQAFAEARTEGIALGDAVAAAAWQTAASVVADTDIKIEIILFDRDGKLMGRAPLRSAHEAAPSRKRRR
jgi:cobalt-precorrin-5B (C1)-methyltransferase